jgi:hypothetical protein
VGVTRGLDKWKTYLYILNISVTEIFRIRVFVIPEILPRLTGGTP